MALTSRFDGFGYNSLKSCWLCDENLLLSCCAARDTHFSAFIVLGKSRPYAICTVRILMTKYILIVDDCYYFKLRVHVSHTVHY